jgi:3-deoxy-D-manno-octulosonate 8-phosphate phosphatase KdsC-like HAD superfamily phosphatase
MVKYSNWPGSETFAKKTGSEIVISKDKKLFADQLNEKFIAIGDDVWDLGLIEKSDRFFAPKDCDRAIRYNSDKIEILNSKGGEGVIAELVWLLCK